MYGAMAWSTTTTTTKHYYFLTTNKFGWISLPSLSFTCSNHSEVLLKFHTIPRFFHSLPQTWETSPWDKQELGSLTNENDDSNENVKKQYVLISKPTALHVHHAFLYISLLSLHNYDVKMPNFTFCAGGEHKNLDTVLKNSSPENSPPFNKLHDLEWERWIL